eukprot:TRINITY_DN12384_c0_g1_i1.p2 TRINITY_DN12384_c0_g1~~TRINITY_DN12384_c0_g1_i1.p2  ORF type:complete len:50 (+),score=9.11 TRINITY_DN12384_c0_g1_i1:243-392(+)
MLFENLKEKFLCGDGMRDLLNINFLKNTKIQKFRKNTNTKTTKTTKNNK